jgi:hypothetical protein
MQKRKDVTVMPNFWKAATAFVVSAAIVAASPLLAAPAVQSQPAQEKQQSDQVSQGVLAKVDVDQQMFWVEDQNGTEVEFQYDSNTKVAGSTEGVQGLSSETGTRVRVYYQEKSGKRIATKIDIIKS